MAEQKRATESQDEKVRPQELERESAAREAVRGGPFAASAGGPIGPPDDIPIRAVAARLGDTRFQIAQRQAMAARIRQVSGNQYLQRAVARSRQGEPIGQARSAWPQQAAVERDVEGTPESTAANQQAALGPVPRDVVPRPPAQAPVSMESRSTHDSSLVAIRAVGPPPRRRQVRGSVGPGVIQLSPLSDELEMMWIGGEREAFFERLGDLGVSDPDVVSFVEQTLTGDDLWRARSLLGLEQPPSAPSAGEEAGEAPEVTAEAAGQQAAGPASAPAGRRQEALGFRLPLDAMRTTLSPVPCGPITITPSLRLSGALEARPTRSALASVARMDVSQRRLEMAQSFGSAFGSAGYQFTAQGLTIDIFDSRFNLRMRRTPTGLEFEAPAQNISSTRGNWRFEGSMGMVLALAFSGNPAIVEALLSVLGAVATVAAALAAAAGFGVALANAVGGGLRAFGMAATRAVPIIVLPGTREILEEQRRGPGGIA